MEARGFLQRLIPEYDEPVRYALQLDEQEIALNDWLGQTLTITFKGRIRCIACGRPIKKTFNNGYCYPCFRDLPENDLCIVKPHECHFHKGTCRDDAFGEAHCMKPHILYLAVSSGVKVGLTRKDNELKRWMDQGALRAIPIAELKDRKSAGELEYHLSQFYQDKTNWRDMLKKEACEENLLEYREEVFARFPERFRASIVRREAWTDIRYPIEQKPEKIKSLNLEKQGEIRSRLTGIKGQYLLFADGVMNMRKFAGYEIEFTA